jgi:exodeoxyribonuclease VII large subunit
MLREARQRLTSVERHEMFRRPTDQINSLRQRLDDRQRAMELEMSRLTAGLRGTVHDLSARLEKQGPVTILSRLRSRLADAEQRLGHSKNVRLIREKDRLAGMETRLAARHPRHGLRLAVDRLAADAVRLRRALDCVLDSKVQRLEGLSKYLNALSPEAVLRRGYSITRRKRDGIIIHSATDVRPGDTLVTRVADGEVESTVEDKRQPKLFE